MTKIDDHACLTGDCPHEKQVDCFNAAYFAGFEECERRAQVLVEALEEISTIDEEYACQPKHFKEVIAEIALKNWRGAE